MTTTANLYVDQGVDFSLRIQLALDESSAQGLTFYSSVRKIYSTESIFDMDIAVEEKEDFFEITLTIDASKSVDTAPGKYQYDLIYKNQDNIVKKLLEGLLFVIPTITKTD